MRRRSRARARALQILYAWEARGYPSDPDRIAQELGAVEPFVRNLVHAVAEHREEIDRRLSEVMPNWRLERLSAVDRAILRLATAEMVHLQDAPGPVCIQEAIQLAERFGTEDSPRFVNGVLDAIFRGWRAEDARRAE